MKTRFTLSSIVLLAVIVIYSCEDKKVTPVAAACHADTVTITYNSGSNTMVAIINTQCGTTNTSCHSPNSASGYDYSGYSGIDANYNNGSLYQGLFGNLPRMPLIPQPGWSDSGSCMLEKFKAWMDQGCPN